MLSKFFKYSEANASEYLKNTDKIFPCYILVVGSGSWKDEYIVNIATFISFQRFFA